MNTASTSIDGLRNYRVVTASYWAFTLTDGAIRMLVLLYFFQLGYSPLEIALLFLFYEFFGVVTNLLGGWIGSRIGLNVTMHLGIGLQVIALSMLTVPEAWLSVPYVMAAQALSGIAKDLNKMSAKASVKLMLPKGAHGRLFKWVAVLTGSKNALKGLGFFVGGWLLSLVGFRNALFILAGSLLLVLLVTLALLPRQLGRSSKPMAFGQLFSRSRNINWLSAARFFLFGSRDIWFVVGLPVYFASQLGWDNARVGGFLALWVIGYGIIQACVPMLLRQREGGKAPGAGTARFWVFALVLVPAGIALGLGAGFDPATVLIVGLGLFALVFAINSAVHSFLVLAYSQHDEAAINVGFYYMANAGGRLLGTVLSGWVYQSQGLAGCLWWSVGLVLAAAILSLGLRDSDA